MWMMPRRLDEGELVGFRPRSKLGKHDAIVASCRRRLRSRPSAYATPRRSRRSRTVSPAAKPLGDLDDRVLAHAVDDQVGLAVEQDRPADRVAPVVVMGQPPQRRLDAAGDDRHAGERLAGAVAVRQRRPVGPQADPAAGRIGVVVADLLVGGVVVDQRVHVAGADGEEQPRPAELPPRSHDRQSGWLSMATRKPAASSTRSRIAIAKLG